MNGADLSLFQFDYDLTFSAFFLNADRTIYGRFGTRSDRADALKDFSMDSFRLALERALEWHAEHPKNRARFAAKTGPRPRYPRPELIPKLKKYSAELDTKGPVAKSCIHCHQVGETLRGFYRDKGEPIPAATLYPYPMPEILGLELDRKTIARVKGVSRGSPAAAAGLRPGDEVAALRGQPILSVADIQWALHGAPDKGAIALVARRGGEDVTLSLELEAGWRARSDLSWRVTTWSLRRMASGGIKLRALSDKERRGAGIKEGRLALEIEHLGQYGPHAAAKRAGFRKGDIFVRYDGLSEALSPTGFLVRGLQTKKPGDRVEAVVLRKGKALTLTLPMQR